MSDPSSCFDFEDVSLEVDGARILDHVDLAIPVGGITVLVGPSGSGKSTLLRLCNRLEVPTSGVVRYRGDDVASLDPLAHRREVGMVFQRPTLFAGTVQRQPARRVARTRADDELVAVLDRVSLDHGFLDRTGDDLSGGEARARLHRPGAADPTRGAVDGRGDLRPRPRRRRAIERLAVDLAGEGLTLLWVTHDLEQAQRLTDRPGSGPRSSS